jgi:hypothetical protein
VIINEFGRFPKERDDFDLEIMNQIVDLTDASATGWNSVNTTPLYGGVEQSPDGKNCLLNIRGDFSTSSTYTLKAGLWTTCSVVHVLFAGTFDSETLSGVTATPSIFKSASECCPSKTTTQVSDFQYFVTQSYQDNNFISKDDPTPGNDFGATVQMTTVFNTHENDVELFATQEEANSVPASHRGRSGIDLEEEEQQFITYCHYDNNGQVVELGFNFKLSRIADYKHNYERVMSPSSASWSYTVGVSGPSNYTTVFQNDAGVVRNTTNRSLHVEYEDNYKAEVLVNSAVVDSRESKQSFTRLIYNLDAVIRDDDYPAGTSSYTWNATTGTPPWDASAGSGSSNMHIDQTKAPTNGGGTTVSELWSEQGEDNDSAYSQSYGIINIVYEDWGVTTGAGDTDFDNVSIVLKNRRFVGLSNNNKGLKTNAHGVYGQVDSAYGNYISYDPYTDTITDSDTPIGYV